MGDVQLSLSQTQFAIDSDLDQSRVHVQVYHPDYATLPEEVRANVSPMVMEWVVGEDGEVIRVIARSGMRWLDRPELDPGWSQVRPLTG